MGKRIGKCGRRPCHRRSHGHGGNRSVRAIVRASVYPTIHARGLVRGWTGSIFSVDEAIRIGELFYFINTILCLMSMIQYE